MAVTDVGATESEQQRIDEICRVIRQSGDDVRRQHPWLANKNAVGMGIFVFAVAGILASGVAYWEGVISAWLCIPLVAFLTSLLHELEHDLIHKQYFRNNKPVHNGMLLTCWALRPGTINPWIRRELHFLHHKKSGTHEDREEQGIGNGQPYGNWLRWLVMYDTLVGNITRALTAAPKGKKLYFTMRILAANFPFAIACALTWYGFLGFHLVDSVAAATGNAIAWSASTLAVMAFVNKLVVVLIAPFYLRSFCLNFISSSMHYYGDVDSLLKQTQVLNAWFLWPFQLFCFNFGSTHAIHHFVVGEPFYIRQLTAARAHAVMKKNGVRFNDLGTFGRDNRYGKDLADEATGQLQPS